MKTLAFTSAILCCFACTNDVGVTDGANGANGATGIGPEETQLQGILVPRCRSVCNVLATCSSATSSCSCSDSSNGANGASSATPSDCSCQSVPYDFDECFSDCLGELGGRFLNNGETCAAAGVDVLDCFAGVDCADFEQAKTNRSDLCGAEAAYDLCPDAADSGDDVAITVPAAPEDGVGGSGSVGVVVGATGGTPAVVGGVAGQSGVGGAAVAGSVTCANGSGMGSAGSSGAPGVNQLLCDSQYGGCSDGHVYRVYCSTSTPELVTCYCIFDGRVQVSYEDSTLLSSVSTPNACSDIGIMSEHCGWSVAATAITE